MNEDSNLDQIRSIHFYITLSSASDKFYIKHTILEKKKNAFSRVGARIKE